MAFGERIVTKCGRSLRRIMDTDQARLLLRSEDMARPSKGLLLRAKWKWIQHRMEGARQPVGDRRKSTSVCARSPHFMGRIRFGRGTAVIGSRSAQISEFIRLQF